MLFSFVLFSCNNEDNASEKKHTPDAAEGNIQYENVNTTANTNASTFTVKGQLENGGGKKLYLYVWAGQQPQIIDSLTIPENGEVELKGIGVNHQFYGIGNAPNNMRLLLLDPKKSITVKGDYNNLPKIEIEGSEDTKILDEFTKKQKAFYEKMQELQIQLKAIPNGQNSQKGKEIVKESEKITDEYTQFVHDFIDKHLNSPAILAAANDLFDPESQKKYLPKIEHALANTMKDTPFHKNVQARIEQLKQPQQAQQPQNGNLQPGMQAHELSFPSPTGKEIALSSLRGKVVLIDFWASWCRPCRMENPNVVKLYNEYKDKGFTVYSVSLDKDKNRWVNAIQQDGLIWPNHVSDLKGWQSKAAQIYAVSGIPYTVLIDKEGKVIATNLRGAQLEEKLKEILG